MTRRRFQPGAGHKEKRGFSFCHSKTPLSLGDGHCRLRSAHSAHVPFLLMEEEAEEAGSPPEAGLLERLLSCWAPNHRSAGCPWDALHGAVTQPRERVTDGAVSMPRTPLNFPHGRQMKLPLYFTTLQVTETQLPPPLTRFHPPEFRSLPCLSELPGLFSLLFPQG